MQNARLDDSQAGIKIAKRNISNHTYVDDTTLMAESKEPLDEGEREEWKIWFKIKHSKNEDHGIRSHQFMANRWWKSGKSDRYYFLGIQNHCGRWLQPWYERRFLLGREAVTNQDSIFKSRDITLPIKAHIVKAMVFPVAMYGCESGTIKKPKYWRIDAFELWCWRRLLRVPWTARSNQSMLLLLLLLLSCFSRVWLCATP